MTKKILFAFLFTLYLLKGYSQIEKHSTQAGIGFLPIFDAFKLFPENKLSGLGISANLGYFAIKKISIGINPFYGQAVNEYDYTQYNVIRRKQENIKIYGLNAYLRYYIIAKNKFLAYPSLAIGFGAAEQRTIDVESKVLTGKENAPAFIFSLGVGINYFITEKFALELHIPYINIKYLTTDVIDPQWQTIAPTIGFQFHWK